MALNFLFANIGYPPFVGGAQTYVQQLAESLVAAGHRVTVYTTDAAEVESIWNAAKPRLAPGTERINGVLVKRLPLRHLSPSPFAYYLIRRICVTFAQLPIASQRLLWGLSHYTPWVPGLEAALAQEEDEFDVAHGFAIPFEPILKATAEYARSKGIPYFLTPFLHVGEQQDQRVAQGYAMPHQISLMRQAAAVVALSEIEKTFLVRKGLNNEQVHVIPAGIPVSHDCSPQGLHAPGDRPSVLFLGAITYEKGAIHLTEAFRRLRDEGLPVNLVLAGTVTDEFRRYYRRLPLDVQARVQLRGTVSEEEKQKLLSTCALLAMPSRVDSFGLVYLEAWARGKPVIGARAGGVPDVIDDGVNGILVPFGDASAIAGAIRDLVSNPERAQRLGQAGHEKLQAQYDWDQVSARLLALYQSLLSP